MCGRHGTGLLTVILDNSRQLKFVCISLMAAIAVGAMGYRYLEERSWVDAFANSCMLVSGQGPAHTPKGKIFVGLYGLFCSCFCVGTIWLLVEPCISSVFLSVSAEEQASLKSTSKSEYGSTIMEYATDLLIV